MQARRRRARSGVEKYGPTAGLVVAVQIAAAASLAGAESPVFVDRAAASGLDFVHYNGMTGQYYFPEMTGQGGALLDYDGDGDLDAYLVQGRLLGPGRSWDQAPFPPPEGSYLGDRLYRNDLVPDGSGGRRPRFVDVTAASGIRAEGYGMGVASGDVDGDGYPDLYVTNYGPNQLWRNRGDGTFEETAAAAGVDDPLWSTSASFVDYDGDGRLDLYSVNYVEFDLERNPSCYAASSRRDYCGPQAFRPQPDRLWRNLGDGRFEDVTLRAFPDYRPGPGLGVVAADFDGDRRPDVYVANDGAPNQLWINRGDGTFREEALFAGAAVNRQGRAEASMGVAVGDFDSDGDEDLFLTHLMGETNTLYVNDGTGFFEDRSTESGLGGGSLPYTAFGTGWLDYDLDGLLDLLVLNGAVRILEEQARGGDPYPLRQPNQLFHNAGGSFVEVPAATAGESFGRLEVSRGLALGDLDNDGDPDALQLNNQGPARLLVNQAGDGAGWLGVSPLAVRGPLLGASFRLGRPGGELRRRSHADGSYASARDPRVTFGLGAGPGAAHLEVLWPDGSRQRWLDPPAGRYLAVPFPAAGRGG